MKYYSIISLIIFLSSSAFASTLKRFNYQQKEMGCDFRILIYSDQKSHADLAAKSAFKRIQEINKTCSDYLAESELNKLSSTHERWVPLSQDLFRVLNYSLNLSERSSGAFDITCGPLSLMWRKARFMKKIPSEDQITRNLERCGYRKIRLMNQQAKLTQQGMLLDLGAVAKGYAIDEAMKVLKHNSIKYAMIDASGDLLMTAHPTGKWTIYLSDHNNSKNNEYIQIKQGALATSGSSLQNLKKDGKTYSHIIDPRTGRALTQNQRVSVFAESAMEADALASSFSVLNFQENSLLLKNCGVRINNGNSIHQSKNFPTVYSGDKL